MNDANDERRLFEQRDKDLAELYPTPESWERSFPPPLPPGDPALRQQYDDYAKMTQHSRVERALHQSEASSEITAGQQQAKRQQDLNTHDQMARGAAEAARDALHDNGPGKEPGAYTTYEARDRAAHTPAAHRIEPEK